MKYIGPRQPVLPEARGWSARSAGGALGRSSDHPVRVTLLNEGTYPFVRGGVSVWCDQLLRALPEYEFDLVTLTATGREVPCWELPPSVTSLQSVPLWGPPRAQRPPPPGVRRAVLAAFADLVRTSAVQEGGSALFADALRRLVQPARAGMLTPVLRSDAGVSALTSGWRAGSAGQDLPVLSLSDALLATVLLEHTLRPLSVRLPDSRLNHAVANGLAALLGVVAKWERGTPLVMSEHGVYLRERFLAYRQAPLGPGARAVMAGFHRQLSALGYRESDVVVPVTDFNRRWAVRAGAAPETVLTVHNGVDPARFPALDGEPAEPVLAWVGRVDPLKDLETMIEAFSLVAAEIEGARLRLFGPVPEGNENYHARCLALVDQLGLGGCVSFEGPVASSREGFETGQVVVLSSISEGLPYSVIEAMMCGRPTVSTDVGGVRECVGDAGLVAPPRDPAAFAAACVALLTDPARRADLSAAGRERALAMFTLDRFESDFRRLYQRVSGSGLPVPGERRARSRLRTPLSTPGRLLAGSAARVVA